MGKGFNIFYSEEEKAFLKANCTMPRKALTAAFNQKFGRDIGEKNIGAMCKRNGWLTGRTGRYEKGSIPANKGSKGIMKPNSGSFRKGMKPKNSLPIGTEVVAKGWVKVKVAEPNIWRNKAHMVWEKHNGKPVPPGKHLLHLDCDFTNNAIDNLVLVSRSDLAKLNKKRFRYTPKEVRLSMVAMSKLDTAIKRRSK